MNKMCWRRYEDHSFITGFDNVVLTDIDGLDLRTTTLVLPELDQMMLDLALESGGTIHWEHRVVDVGQDADKAWVDVETKDGKKRLEADYIIGADGANSTVRKTLFGKEFPASPGIGRLLRQMYFHLLAPLLHAPWMFQDVTNKAGCRFTTTSRGSMDSTTRTSSSTPSTSSCVPPLESPALGKGGRRERKYG